MNIEHSNEVRISENIVVNGNKKTIRLSKQTYIAEDIMAINFARVLEEFSLKYAVVAGYIAILFGRARRSDDIDFIVEKINEDIFVKLCKALKLVGFSFIQGNVSSEDSVRDIYKRYLAEGHAIRFIYENIFLPNIELKMISSPFHDYSIKHAYIVILNDKDKIKIAPLEFQIAYKLYLGSAKDVGDAVFLYNLFKPTIKEDELEKWCMELEVDLHMLHR
ncbi:MAG: hypothetical protein ACP5GU_01620 [Thermoprotei archaeon]